MSSVRLLVVNPRHKMLCHFFFDPLYVGGVQKNSKQLDPLVELENVNLMRG